MKCGLKYFCEQSLASLLQSTGKVQTFFPVRQFKNNMLKLCCFRALTHIHVAHCSFK